RVTEYSLRIAEKLNLPRKEIEMLKFCGPLHDIGKVGTDENILRRPSKLTEGEYKIIKEHPVTGENIIKHIKFLKEGLPVIRHHHERYDGKGYPDGLKGKNIPLLARILAVADAFDAMTSDRPYRKAFSYQEAITKLKEGSGTQFDPEIVKVAVDIFRIITKIEL
ncbi:MAG: HD-GYP domain-containing protein, partial [Deltaproteobacteria bacterium]|nr:HD-GYP domain-containing protein [Deltaproteobacteria bacterium]